MDFPISETDAVSQLKRSDVPTDNIDVVHPKEITASSAETVVILPSYSEWLGLRHIIDDVGERHFCILGCRFYKSMLEMSSHRHIKVIPVCRGVDRSQCKGCYNYETCEYARRDDCTRDAPNVVWFTDIE